MAFVLELDMIVFCFTYDTNVRIKLFWKENFFCFQNNDISNN
jgi:hypothetical protein